MVLIMCFNCDRMPEAWSQIKAWKKRHLIFIKFAQIEEAYLHNMNNEQRFFL